MFVARKYYGVYDGSASWEGISGYDHGHHVHSAVEIYRDIIMDHHEDSGMISIGVL